MAKLSTRLLIAGEEVAGDGDALEVENPQNSKLNSPHDGAGA
ncbi:MAG: hypothetical protein ACR2G3_09795 [Solirubrobacterales bacterium]